MDNAAVEELLSLIGNWKKDRKMKGDRHRAVEMADHIRMGGVGQVRATGPPMAEASNAAAVFVFSQQVLAAVKDGLKDILPATTPTAPVHGPCHPAPQEQAQHAPRPRVPQPPSELLVTISMAKADCKSPNCLQIETALGKLTAPGLCDSKVHSMRKLVNSNICVQANTEEQAKLLLLHEQEWTTLFEPDACVHRETFKLVANYAPTSFNPKVAGAKAAIYYNNQGTIPSPSAIRDVYWLHEQKDTLVKKAASSLVVVLEDAAAADALIVHSLSLAGTSCPVSYFTPPSSPVLPLPSLWPYGQGVLPQ
ncbi:hypothetical protein B0H14DRAFT_3458803 [Mycena olivaceomarginata]|nr:hypothetical protein B0H14DRAFT_3458803 [Mycena olivaceomarginata]